jgi:hypothetical protein
MIGFARPKAALRIRASLDVARKPFRQSAADNICGEDQADLRAWAYRYDMDSMKKNDRGHWERELPRPFTRKPFLKRQRVEARLLQTRV